MKRLILDHGILINGDCIEALQSMEPNSIDAMVTDPPYGLSKEPDITEVLSHWIAGDKYEHTNKGFMGKGWDSFVPGPEYWKEIYRVLKPGAHILVFCSTRTWDLLSIAIRFAGFQNRDTIRREYIRGEPECIDAEGNNIDINSLAWVFGTGFPKSLNVGEAIEKKLGFGPIVVGQRPSGGGDNFDARRAGEDRDDRPKNHCSGTRNIQKYQTSEAQQFKGHGTALKPSWEVILMFRKPFETTVANNVLEHGTGSININGCRISTHNNLNRDASDYQPGRWPTNLILSHHPDCKPSGVKEVKNNSGSVSGNEPSSPAKNVYGEYKRKGWEAHGNNGVETVENWDCVKGCPIKEMDQQSGIKQSGAMKKTVPAYSGVSNTGFLRGSSGPQNQHGDKGGASRFFLNIPMFRYIAKASRKERELGCDGLEHKTAGEVTGGRKEGSAGLDNPRAGAGRTSGAKNIHPTIKPLDLIRYLCRLICPPNGIILDPFLGSGTTAMATILEGEGRSFIGIEKDEKYFEIASVRTSYIEKGGIVEVKQKIEKKKNKTNTDTKTNFFNT